MTQVEIPHSNEAEMITLGCMLTSTDCVMLALDIIGPEDFYHPHHGIIFSAIRELHGRQSEVDVSIVSQFMKDSDQLKSIGGVSYLASLCQFAGTSANFLEYIKIIDDKSTLRKIIRFCIDTHREAMTGNHDVTEFLDEAQKKLCAIGSGSTTKARCISEILTEFEEGKSFLQVLQERQERFTERQALGGISGIPTGFFGVDHLIDGLGKSNLIVVAARPGMGKTAFVLNIAEHVCFELNIPVGIFSLEMDADQLMGRLISSHSGVNSVDITKGSISGADYQNIVVTVKSLEEKNLYIDDHPQLTIAQIRSRARTMKETQGVQLIIIDYLQLISSTSRGKMAENRQMEVAEISKMMKGLARELRIPLICVAQLSRKVEERQDHKPVMSDLRESGAIEQDSDQIMFLTRKDYYDKNLCPGTATLIVAKNRHGATGEVPLNFEPKNVKFSSASTKGMDED